ncbi:MAG: hypothetical protein D6690_17610 [Nitrospirae bacterium]|nr:MAG: hypothetical protein D6690_17610 [Nitrospirota bacterium]
MNFPLQHVLLMRKLSPDQFRDKLFDVLRRKQHWTISHFNGPSATRAQLNIRYHQEYAVYIRDFSVLLAHVIAKNPPWKIRRHLATTIYEEETGGLSLGSPHQELFLQMMSGLGFDRASFRDVELLGNSRVYREWLDHICQTEDWLIGASVLTIFVEGTIHDPDDVQYLRTRKSTAEIEDLIQKHPLVLYHGLSPDHMNFIRVQEMIEPANRKAAYDMIIEYATDSHQQQHILQILEEALKLWLRYQDGIARACGLHRNP